MTIQYQEIILQKYKYHERIVQNFINNSIKAKYTVREKKQKKTKAPNKT